MGTTAAKLVNTTRRRYGLALVLGALVLLVGGTQHAHAQGGPFVNVTQPAGGSTISGVISIAADASSDVGIDRVEFQYFDGATGRFYPLGTDTTAPYTTCFDTTKVPNTNGLNGTVYATAYDTTGASTREGSGVTVSNGEASNPGNTSGDSLQPCSLSLRLGVGTTKNVDATLHFDKLPPKADVLLALDTTGSMQSAINDARGDADSLVSTLQNEIPSAKFAVADFKDYPDAIFNNLGGPGDYPWRVDQDFTANAPDSSCSDGELHVTEIACALQGLQASGGDDLPEAYNRAFYEAYSDADHLHWDPGASRFMIVLGDSLPHDAGLATFDPDCPNTPPTDPGSAFTVGNAQYGAVGPLQTLTVLDGLKANHTNLSFVTYNAGAAGTLSGTPACQAAIAKYTGGAEVVHGPDTAGLATQIVNLVNAAASRIDRITQTVTQTGGPAEVDGSSWIALNVCSIEGTCSAVTGPATAPTDIALQEKVSVPQDATKGDYHFRVTVSGDGVPRAVQEVTVTVTDTGVSALTMTSDDNSIPAGIASVPFESLPSDRLNNLTADPNAAPAGSTAQGSIAQGSIGSGTTAQGSIAQGSIAQGSIAMGSIAQGSIAQGSIAVGSIAMGSIGLGTTAQGSIAQGSIPGGATILRNVLLSQIPLTGGASWADVLRNTPFAVQPLQAVTLYDVATYSVRDPSDNKTPWERLNALTLAQAPFFSSLWRNVPLSAVLLGNAPLASVPIPLGPDGHPYASWSAALTGNGGSASNLDVSQNTAFGVAIAGQLGTTNLGTIAIGSIAQGSIAQGSIRADQTAVGSIAIGSIDLRLTHLGSIPLTALRSPADIVACSTSFDCTGKTLGQVSAANAFKPGVTLFDVLNQVAPPNGTLTIDELARAMLALADFPWELADVQGLQDVAGTGQNVHYHVDFDLVCAAATSFSVHVHLPDGFFPVKGSSTVAYGAAAAIPATDPTGPAGDPVWTAPGSPCGASSATQHVRLNFQSYAGLTLGSQTSDVAVTAADSTYSASNQASVLVTQNWEPSDDPATGPTIAKNTLVVGHIATSNDIDYFRVPLDNLAPNTKVTAYLKVPQDADLDLVINKPSAPGVQSSAQGSIAQGSIAVGSIPIEDTASGVDSSTLALQPDAQSDLTAASTAQGSIAQGSIAQGSISANRGDVNEVAQIVTHGETGAAVIGIGGYNGAFSNHPYVLRIKVTPPPPLPPCDPVTGLDTPTAGTLPAVTSLPTSTKALFLVNRQRLAGLYGAAAADSLVNSSTTSPLNRVAASVNGAVLPVDGSAAVRTAYSQWDANPCDLEKANAVVRSINDLVATYRARLPQLKYVVLLGTDTAVPSWRQQDLSNDSPEIDEANDLVFTTRGLTKGNATYATAARNAILTDGAYGHFQPTNWLGHDIPLPEISVSRVVESPDDINAQLTQYLAVNGQLNPTRSLTTGDSFFEDGAHAADTALQAQFPSLSHSFLGTTPTPWTHANVLASFFNASPVPDIGAIWAHYSHWLAQPANVTPAGLAGLASTGDISPTYPVSSRLIFTVGCHSGLNVPDTLLRPDTVAAQTPDTRQRFLDWAQAYMANKAAVYVANTGFGYGDTTTSDLSERLYDHFANNLNSGGTVGEQWLRALHQYYSEPSNYDVLDEKVMIEATMYGLPFYTFGGTPQHVPPAVTPPSHSVVNGIDTASVPAVDGFTFTQGSNGLFTAAGRPDGSTFTSGGAPWTMGTLSVFYRPAQPTVSRDVTVPGTAAHGVWIRSLTTSTQDNVTPYKPFPLVHDANERPVKDYPNIFFPATMATINRDVTFGTEHDTAVVNLGRFFPSQTGDLSKGTEQLVSSIGLDVGYSTSADVTPPTIFQTSAVQTGTSITAFVRVGDASGLARVAVLYHELGDGTWHVVQLDHASGDLWSKTFTIGSANPIQLDSEAQDINANVAYSFNKAVNFQSVPDNVAAHPSITIDNPLPAPTGTFTLNQRVSATFACSSTLGIASCNGATDGGASIVSGGFLDTSKPGPHTFTVAAEDVAGNAATKSVTYVVQFGFGGFQQPVDNPPIVNVASAGSIVPLKWTLLDAAGQPYANLNALQTIVSKQIRCPNGGTDPVNAPEIPIGTTGVAGVSGGVFHFNWSTDKKWAGTCRRLLLHLSDGTTPYADFQFK